jgi:hypothetical protein
VQDKFYVSAVREQMRSFFRAHDPNEEWAVQVFDFPSSIAGSPIEHSLRGPVGIAPFCGGHG